MGPSGTALILYYEDIANVWRYSHFDGSTWDVAGSVLPGATGPNAFGTNTHDVGAIGNDQFLAVFIDGSGFFVYDEFNVGTAGAFNPGAKTTIRPASGIDDDIVIDSDPSSGKAALLVYDNASSPTELYVDRYVSGATSLAEIGGYAGMPSPDPIDPIPPLPTSGAPVTNDQTSCDSNGQMGGSFTAQTVDGDNLVIEVTGGNCVSLGIGGYGGGASLTDDSFDVHDTLPGIRKMYLNDPNFQSDGIDRQELTGLVNADREDKPDEKMEIVGLLETQADGTKKFFARVVRKYMSLLGARALLNIAVYSAGTGVAGKCAEYVGMTNPTEGWQTKIEYICNNWEPWHYEEAKFTQSTCSKVWFTAALAWKWMTDKMIEEETGVLPDGAKQNLAEWYYPTFEDFKAAVGCSGGGGGGRGG